MAMKKVGGLWLNEKDGRKYFSGRLSEAIPAEAKVFVFKNTYKQAGENTPDYTINVPQDEERSEREFGQVPTEEAPF